MAGGPLARTVACDTCSRAGRRTPARRTHEGSEDDHYTCPLGHTFGIHWRGPPTRPTWPTDEAIAAEAHRRWLARGGGDGRHLDDWLAAEQALLDAGP